jgi:hypothetical protein
MGMNGKDAGLQGLLNGVSTGTAIDWWIMQKRERRVGEGVR